MSDRAADLLKRLEVLILQETAQQREHLESQWSLPLAERVRTGKAIEGLRLSGINDGTGRVALTCQTNNSRFREGDYLFLHKSHPLKDAAFECVLELGEEQYLEVVPQAYATDLVYLIQGPPGTGKTLVLTCVGDVPGPLEALVRQGLLVTEA